VSSDLKGYFFVRSIWGHDTIQAKKEKRREETTVGSPNDETILGENPVSALHSLAWLGWSILIVFTTSASQHSLSKPGFFHRNEELTINCRTGEKPTWSTSQSCLLSLRSNS